MDELNSNNLEDVMIETEKLNGKTNPKADLRLSTYTDERVKKLEDIRNMSWFDRNFRSLSKGSMRGVVIMWIRMTLGVGVLTLPHYLSVYGWVYGTIAIVLAGLINLNSYYNIFAASTAINEKDYLNLIEKTLGPVIFNIFKLTFFLDMSSSFIIIVIVCWNLFEYSMYFLNLTDKSWFKDPKKVEFDENNPTLAGIRGYFFLILVLISIPFFLKKTLRSIQKITILILFLLLILLVFIVFQTPFFYEANKDSPRIAMKDFDGSWIECFFSILLSYYVQPFIFSLREELLIPSQERMNKVATITVSFEVVLFCVVGLAGYASLGETFMTDLFLTRKPYDGENQIIENIYRGLIMLFFLLSCLGIAIFNPTMRDYLRQTLHLGDGKKTYVVLSLLPFFVYCLIAFKKPNIIDVFNWTGLTICNFNGYIVPSLMRIQVLRAQNGSKIRMSLEILQVVVLSSLCVIGVVYKIMHPPAE